MLKATRKGLGGKNRKKKEGGRFNKGEHNLEYNQNAFKEQNLLDFRTVKHGQRKRG